MLWKKQKQTPLPMHTPEMRGKERAAFLSKAKEKQAAVHTISICGKVLYNLIQEN